MQKINSIKMVSFEPKVDLYDFLRSDLLPQRKDFFLNFSETFGPAQHVTQRRTLWDDIGRFVHKDFNFKIGKIQHTIPVAQLITSTCLLCAGLLVLYMI